MCVATRIFLCSLALCVLQVLTEAEFLVDQLLANELVDEAAVVAIQRQFKVRAIPPYSNPISRSPPFALRGP